jgi:glycosyltransferase involved in cell wall biosynthesis
MNKAKVSIILSALNETETIGKVIDEIPQAGFRASRI